MGDFESVKIMSNIFIAFIGSGVLGLPYAFKRSGILEGALIMSAVAYFSAKAMLLLIDCQYRVRTNLGVHAVAWEDLESSNKDPFIKTAPAKGDASQSITYSDVAAAALGPVGRAVVESSLVCAQVGFCCGYLIFIVENLAAYGSAAAAPKAYWVALTLPPLFLLTMVPDLGKLAVFSLLAQVSNLTAFAVVFWFDFHHLAAPGQRKEVSAKGFPFFFCASVYCFEGAGMVISLEQSLPPDRRPFFKRYLVATIVFITALYVSFGTSGYLSFGSETEDIITHNLMSDADGFDFALLVKSFLCVSLFFSFPIMLFPVTRLLQRKVEPKHAGGKRSVAFAVRLVLVLLCGFFVCVIPNFSDLMNIIGAVFGTVLAFVMPALCHLALFRNGLDRKEVVLDWTLVALGCLGCVLGLFEAFYGGDEGTRSVPSAAVAAKLTSDLNQTVAA